MGKVVLKKVTRSFTDKRDIAIKYFSILSILGDIDLSNKEIDLLSYIAVKGTFNSINSRKEFMQIYNTTKYVINNLICQLYKKKMLVKVDGKTRINPKVDIDFVNQDSFSFNIRCLFQNELKIK